MVTILWQTVMNTEACGVLPTQLPPYINFCVAFSNPFKLWCNDYHWLSAATHQNPKRINHKKLIPQFVFPWQINFPQYKTHITMRLSSTSVTSTRRSSSSSLLSLQKRRSSSPSSISTNAKGLDDEAAMMRQYLQDQNRHANMPETWSVKLPAAYQQQPQQQPKPKARKSHPPPSSMFRGHPSQVSPAVAHSFGAVEDDADEWLERREPFGMIEESTESKRKWKRWFLNHWERLATIGALSFPPDSDCRQQCIIWFYINEYFILKYHLIGLHIDCI